MKLQLEALDPLFFRDGRPFTMGEESYAEGVFPPLPSTVRGALRSLWISQQLNAPDADKDLLADASRKIEIRYFGLGISSMPVFPAPLDLFFPERKEEEPSDMKKTPPAQPMKLIETKGLASSAPTETSHLFRADANGKSESVAGYLIDAVAMRDYIDGKKAVAFETFRLANFVKKEHKIGIGRDNETHRTEDGLLFRLVANRFNDESGKSLQLIVEVNGFEGLIQPISKFAAMPLGGERRSVVASASEFSLPDKPAIKGKVFKVCLLTPALLDAWYPKHLCDDYPGLRLVAACIGKPVSVGGWDVLKQCPKPMRRATPAGSVYLFEAANETQANQITQKYHGESICKPTDDLEGFGICFIAQPFDNQQI